MKIPGSAPGHLRLGNRPSAQLYARTPRYEWPPFLVTAPHRVRRSHDAQGRWEPYELWHARVPGALTTACGVPSIGWPIFWWLRFDKGGGPRCGDCARAIEVEGAG
jgi:hypothetical protein